MCYTQTKVEILQIKICELEEKLKVANDESKIEKEKVFKLEKDSEFLNKRNEKLEKKVENLQTTLKNLQRELEEKLKSQDDESKVLKEKKSLNLKKDSDFFKIRNVKLEEKAENLEITLIRA